MHNRALFDNTSGKCGNYLNSYSDQRKNCLLCCSAECGIKWIGFFYQKNLTLQGQVATPQGGDTCERLDTHTAGSALPASLLSPSAPAACRTPSSSPRSLQHSHSRATPR